MKNIEKYIDHTLLNLMQRKLQSEKYAQKPLNMALKAFA